jgi:hypothetical protein
LGDSAAIFLILELDSPFVGFMQISDMPLRDTICASQPVAEGYIPALPRTARESDLMTRL